MSTDPSQRDRAIELVRDGGILTAREASDHGIHSQVLTRLVSEGALLRVARGVYRYPDAPVTEHHALALVSAGSRHGVVCLLSALAFHEIGTQIPGRVWVAVDRRARAPTVDWPPLKVVRFSGPALSEGIESHVVEGVTVRVYTPAKTVADLFKYRNKIGVDVALEALSEVWNSGLATMEQLTRFARICRVERVMQPYLQATVR